MVMMNRIFVIDNRIIRSDDVPIWFDTVVKNNISVNRIARTAQPLFCRPPLKVLRHPVLVSVLDLRVNRSVGTRHLGRSNGPLVAGLRRYVVNVAPSGLGNRLLQKLVSPRLFLVLVRDYRANRAIRIEATWPVRLLHCVVLT